MSTDWTQLRRGKKSFTQSGSLTAIAMLATAVIQRKNLSFRQGVATKAVHHQVRVITVLVQNVQIIIQICLQICPVAVTLEDEALRCDSCGSLTTKDNYTKVAGRLREVLEEESGGDLVGLERLFKGEVTSVIHPRDTLLMRASNKLFSWHFERGSWRQCLKYGVTVTEGLR